MDNKHMTIDEFIGRFFTKESAPSVYTIRRWIASGELKAVKIGRQYYISENNPFDSGVTDKTKQVAKSPNQPYQPQKEYDPILSDDPAVCALVNNVLMSK